MIERIIKFLHDYNLSDKTIIVGFSGGYDSMCLMDIMIKISQKEDFKDMKVIAAHFNHNWRGEESQKEQEVCRIFAKVNNIEFYTRTAPKPIKKNENEARILRYEFFEDAIDEFDADAVFTAHNKDDNAETILYRVIKGTGLVGLKGISKNRDKFYRPLLTTFRSEILDYCKTNCLSPNSDSSNFDTNYKRNYLRLNIIPACEKINPSVKEALNTLGIVANNENAIIEEYLKEIRHKIYKDDIILSSEFKTLSNPVRLRIIHEYLQKYDLDYDYKKITEINNFIEENINQRNGNTISLATALWLYVDDKIIETIPKKTEKEEENFEIEINGEGEYNLGKFRFAINKYNASNVFIFPESTSTFMYVDLSKVSYPLKIRKRKDGDIIKPFGMNGTMKLKKFFNSKGVARHKRDDVFLLASDEEILWAMGVGLSNTIAVDTTPTHIIQLLALKDDKAKDDEKD